MTNQNPNNYMKISTLVLFSILVLGSLLYFEKHDLKYILYPLVLIAFVFFLIHSRKQLKVVEKKHPLATMAILGIFLPASTVFILDIIGYLLDRTLYYPLTYLLGAVGFGLFLILLEKLRKSRGSYNVHRFELN